MIFLFLKPSVALLEAKLARLKIGKKLATFEKSPWWCSAAGSGKIAIIIIIVIIIVIVIRSHYDQ